MTSLRNLIVAVAVSVPLAASAQVPPVKFKFSGALNHQALAYTDQATLYSASETIGSTGTPAATVSDKTLEESFINFKYRLNFEGATEGNTVKGVYGIEIGGIRFGQGGNKTVGTPADAIGTNGGSYSGDGDNYETRFAYIDFGLPGSPKSRLTIGLQPFTVNHYVWKETAAGIQFKSPVGAANLTAAWVRTRDQFTTSSTQEIDNDGDNYLVRGDFAPAPDVKVGAFALYQHSNPETAGASVSSAGYQVKRWSADTTYDIYNIGVDGSLKLGDLFVNADLIYQGGEVEGGRDVNAFFVHGDVGINLGKLKLTYTGWYASGDGDTDPDIENYMTTDVDMTDSIVLFEGGYMDEGYFTEAPHFLNFGAIFNKVAADYQVLPNVTVGAAVMYIMTAEDITLANGAKENVLGTELDAYVSYKPYPQLELALNAGYLFAGDAMDRFETSATAGNGKADADIFRSTARILYSF